MPFQKSHLQNLERAMQVILIFKKSTYVDVKLGFMSNMNDNVGKGLGLSHGAGLESSQSVCTRIGLQEQVVLLHVMNEALLGQRSVGDALDKGMLSVFLPVVLARLEEVPGQWARVVTRRPIRQ